MIDWTTYNKQTVGKFPRPLLIEALSHTRKKEKALDLGAGALNDTYAMLASDFNHVAVVDSNAAVGDCVTELNEKGGNATFYCTSYEDFHYEPNRYDLVNAQYALPFAGKHLPEVIEGIKKATAKHGIVTANFFGLEDGWAMNIPHLAFVSRETIEELFPSKEWKIIRLDESKQNGPLASGGEKFWHLINLIAKKK